MSRFLKLLGFGYPTTVGYQFLLDKKTHSVVQYFAEDWLEIAVELYHGIGHHFLTIAFTHWSTLGIVYHNDGMVCLVNADDLCHAVGWGAKSNSNEEYIHGQVQQHWERNQNKVVTNH